MKFKLTYIAFPIATILVACDNSYRNNVIQQVEDMELCRKANIEAYTNRVGEIKCSPKPEEYQNFERDECNAK